MSNDPSPPTLDWLGLMIAGFLGVLGRLYVLAHSDPRRRGWEAIWELMIGFPLGLIGWGLADAANVENTPIGVALIVVTSIGGARVVDAVIAEVLDRIARRKAGGA